MAAHADTIPGRGLVSLSQPQRSERPRSLSTPADLGLVSKSCSEGPRGNSLGKSARHGRSVGNRPATAASAHDLDDASSTSARNPSARGRARSSPRGRNATVLLLEQPATRAVAAPTSESPSPEGTLLLAAPTEQLGTESTRFVGPTGYQLPRSAAVMLRRVIVDAYRRRQLEADE